MGFELDGKASLTEQGLGSRSKEALMKSARPALV